MSVYNIVRKRQVLETNLKSEEITNFYPVFIYILVYFYSDFFQNCNVFFTNLTSGWWAYSIGEHTRTQFLLSISRNRCGFSLVGYRNGKSATAPALVYSNLFVFLEPVDEPWPTYAW